MHSNPSEHMPSQKHTNTQTLCGSLQFPVSSHLQCTCACPPLQSSQAVHQVQWILIVLSPVSPSLSFSYPPPSLSLNLPLSLSRSTVAHAAETLYLIHYNTSRLTPSQMGGWVLLVLANWAVGCFTGCCAPLQLLLPPSLLPCCPCSAKTTRWQEILGSAASLPEWKCPVTYGSVHSTGWHLIWEKHLPWAYYSPVSSGFIAQFIPLYTTWPLQCDIPTYHTWERLPRQLRTPPAVQPPSRSLAHSVTLFDSFPSPLMCFSCHIITLNLPGFNTAAALEHREHVSA